MNISANEYFLSLHTDSKAALGNYKRVANAIKRHGGVNEIITMGRLCAMSKKELGEIRNLGPKGLAIVTEECQRFLSEKNESEDST